MRYTLCLLVALLTVPLLAQQQGMPPNNGTPKSPGQDQTMPVPNGARLPTTPSSAATAATQPVNANEAREQIQDKLDADPALKGTRVIAQVVDDHTIALTGTVHSKADHDHVLDIAEKNSGDRALVDRITIGNGNNNNSPTTSNPQ